MKDKIITIVTNKDWSLSDMLEQRAAPLIDVVSEMFKLSKTEVRRLIQQGAVAVNDKIISKDDTVYVLSHDIVRVGKHRFFKVM